MLDAKKSLILENGNGKEAITTGPMKVSIICDAILAELQAQYAKSHTQSILTAHLSKIPPDVPAALRVIADLKGHSLERYRVNRQTAIQPLFPVPLNTSASLPMLTAYMTRR